MFCDDPDTLRCLAIAGSRHSRQYGRHPAPWVAASAHDLRARAVTLLRRGADVTARRGSHARAVTLLRHGAHVTARRGSHARAVTLLRHGAHVTARRGSHARAVNTYSHGDRHPFPTVVWRRRRRRGRTAAWR